MRPPKQPVQLRRPHVPERAHPNYLTWWREPGPTTLPEQQVRRGVERVYKRESGRNTKESATYDHLTEPNPTP